MILRQEDTRPRRCSWPPLRITGSPDRGVKLGEITAESRFFSKACDRRLYHQVHQGHVVDGDNRFSCPECSSVQRQDRKTKPALSFACPDDICPRQRGVRPWGFRGQRSGTTGLRRSRTNLQTVRDELTDRFGGATLHVNAPAEGIWENDGYFQRDHIVVVEVMTSDIDHAWWDSYRKDLEFRFRQQEIVLRAMHIARL